MSTDGSPVTIPTALGSNEALLDGIPGCGAARFDVQLGIDGSKVGIDRPRADVELLAELPVGQPAANESQDLDFTRGQAICSGASRHGGV